MFKKGCRLMRRKSFNRRFKLFLNNDDGISLRRLKGLNFENIVHEILVSFPVRFVISLEISKKNCFLLIKSV